MNSWLRIHAIIRKELLQLKRDRMTFAMVVMIPLLQLLLFGFAINTNIRHIPVGLVDYSDSTVSRVLVQIAQATQVVQFVQRFNNEADALAAIESAQVRAVLVIPKDLTQRLSRHPSLNWGSPALTERMTIRPLAHWMADGGDTLIAAAIRSLRTMPLHELLKRPANRILPTFEVTLLYNPEQRTVVNVVPGLVGIILTMTMIMFTAAAIVRERERGNLEMLINTPIKPLELMIGKITPFIFIGLLQMTIILGLGRLIFNVPINGSLFQLILATLLFIGASLSFGLVLSTLAKNQLQSMQMTIFVLLPSILLSGFIFPYEGMPPAAQTIAEFIPATSFMRIIRGVVLRDATLWEMNTDALTLALFIVVGLGIASMRFRKTIV